MARNGSGSHAIPITFTDGTTAVADDVNTNFSDLSAEITNSLALDGQSTMTAPLKAANGAEALPAYTFGSDPNTGFYRVSSDTIGVSLAGSKTAEFHSTGSGLTLLGAPTSALHAATKEYVEKLALPTSLAKTGAYTLLAADIHRTVQCDASGGAFTVTLLAAATAGDGFETTILKTDSTTNAVTIDGDGSETINGTTTISLGWRWRSVTLRSNGTAWLIVRETEPDPPGTIYEYAGTTLPANRLWANGEAVSRTTYASLYAWIGTTYGTGDGSTTFNLPDRCGRVGAGQDDMGGISSKNRLTGVTGSVNADTLGATGGTETHTLTEAQMPLHGHDYRVSGSAAASTVGFPGGFLTHDLNDFTKGPFTGTATDLEGEQIGGAGGGAAHPNVQPTIILNYVIKI